TNAAFRTNMKGAIRTVTFEVAAPTVWIKVRGKADGFLVVDSHRLVKGPLHGRTKFKVNAGDKFVWQAVKVQAYMGHRPHIEFVATGNFAIAEVRQGDRPAGADIFNPLIMKNVEAASTFAELASGVQKSIGSAVQKAGAGSLVGQQDSPASAELANWTMANDALLQPAAASPTAKKFTAGLTAYQTQRAQLVKQLPPSNRTVLAMADGDHEEEVVYVRGNPKNPGEIVPKGFLPALSFEEQTPIKRRSGRLELARRITADSSPAARRVIVNRIWQHMFGRGIVPTPDNFGKLGLPPTHPELLDYLATDFSQQGWSIKSMIRKIALSKTYQMSSKPSDAGTKADPKNELLHRQRIRRLEGEVIRDAILAVSGRLDPKQFGKSIPIHLTPFMSGRGRPSSGPIDGHGRRSIYLSVRRNFLSPMMLAFGTPIPFNAMGKREDPNVPGQALILMNNPLVVAEAKRWSESLRKLPNMNDDQRIEAMYVKAIGRPPTEKELADALGFLKEQGTRYGQPSHPQAWADLCHVMFNTKEFIHVY
ncbi:MAG: DUF1553 domain-containing protein, partial [Pirellulales bacterium]|nr:DUF1553 domain-containing protein [Pirellulales bacterium]